MNSTAEIEAFVAVARQQGVTRAAAHLNRSQPAITRRIRQLEKALGAPLIERGPGGAVLSEAGRAFLPHAEAALAAIRDGAEAVAALSRDDAGVVSLAIVGTLADSPLVAHLQAYLRRHPDLRLDLRTANSQEVSAQVRRGEVALGLRYFADAGADLVSQDIGAEPLILVCAADHRFAGKRPRPLSQLGDERWLAFPAGRNRPPSSGHQVENQLAKAGLGDAEMLTVDSLTAQKRLVEAGFGIALLPRSAIREELRLGTLATIAAPSLAAMQPVCAVHRRNGYLNGACRALLDDLRSAKIAF
ncbi:MAG: LysR family transcriptional regulator [Alphaproteobacteria bacterium]